MRVWVAIWTGSTVICGRIGAWIAGGPLARVTGLLLAAGFAKGLPHTTTVAYVAAAAWIVTAVAYGLRTPTQPDCEEATEETVEQPKLTADTVTAALHAVAAPHAQLEPAADHLGCTTADLRAVLKEMGVPVAGGVRMKGRGVSTGVREQDLPPLPRDHSPATEGALTSDNNSNNAPTVERQAGMTIIRDPADRKRRRTLLRR